jgi:hypothetical protein
VGTGRNHIIKAGNKSFEKWDKGAKVQIFGNDPNKSKLRARINEQKI